MEETKNQSNPSAALGAAIEKLDVLIQHNEDSASVPHIHNLEIKNGKLVATSKGSFEKIVDLTCCLIAPLISPEARSEQVRKKQEIHKEIAEALDVVKGHLDLIPRLQQGSPTEKKLASYATNVISKYNEMVGQSTDSSWVSRFACYIYKKSDLLLEDEIRNRVIVPKKSIAAQSTLKELGVVLSSLGGKKAISPSSSTHKKPIKVMLDAFHLKTIQALKEKGPMREIMDLVRNTSVDIDDDSTSDLIWMHQVIEVNPGTFARLSGAFKRRMDGKLMSIPILDHFKCTFHTHRPGYPMASEHAGWVLPEALVDANPLRSDQTPIFNGIEEQIAKVSSDLLSDPEAIAKAKQMIRLKREVFNQNKEHFVELLFQKTNALVKAAGAEVSVDINNFYAFVLESESPYDTLSHANQYWAYYFVSQPAQKLREAWLGGAEPVLRTGKYAEKLEKSSQLIDQEFQSEKSNIQTGQVEDRYVLAMAELLGPAVKNILLQYMSDKISYAPPMLNDFEQRLQLCAFQQAFAFFDEMDIVLDASDDVNRKFIFEWLERLLKQDIDVFTVANIEEAEIVNELAIHFNSRFYARQREPKE